MLFFFLHVGEFCTFLGGPVAQNHVFETLALGNLTKQVFKALFFSLIFNFGQLSQYLSQGMFLNNTSMYLDEGVHCS